MSIIKLSNSNIAPKERVGRGIGSGSGKTCGRGHKGLGARSGGSVKVTFEGGQNPLIKCLPKQGFNSRKALFSAKLPLSAIINLDLSKFDNVLTLKVLKDLGLIKKSILFVKIYNNMDKPGKIKFKLDGIKVTKSIQELMD